ncbi:phenoloxidase-activating factor 2-like [Anopheles aquasalis]|uniref:phenoloxidase-activating factor 2-like n=1 Tax=Anopheles aquasalis TaxID=42839 RepID=UPI00215A6378|nr:phenoloxidase-activating factor 2-like [Anopheles aquasalis]
MVRGCYKRLALLVVLCIVGVSARSTGEPWPCIADDGSDGYWPPGCSHAAIEPRSGGSDENCTCISKRSAKAPKAQIHSSCTADDGSRGFWPTGCHHTAIVPKFGCSCVKLAECRNNSHYCVYQADCAVPTSNLRNDNCPLKELKCCPKPSTREEITPYIGDLAMIFTEDTGDYKGVADPQRTVNKNPSGAEANSPERGVTPGTPVDPTTDPEDIEEPEASSTDSVLPASITTTTEDPFKVASPSPTNNQTPASITTTTENPEKKPLPPVNPTGNVVPVVVDTTPASNITASDIAPLSESFVFTACGQRVKDGLVPQKMRDQQDRAEYGEIPWMAAIFQMPTNDNGSENSRYCCNGALISQRAVLTTAHCVSICGGNVNKIMVRLGEWDLNVTIEVIPPKQVRVRKAHKHKDFVIHSLINNIAVLELASDVQYGPTVQPVCLPEKDYPSLSSREILIFTGWGKTVMNTPSSNGHNFLKKVILRNNEQSICKEEMKSYDSSHRFELHPSFVCATQVHEEQPCRGDAGAPVVVEVPYSENRYYIHGLVSWGYDCSRPDRPNTALTNVRGFRVWIKQTLANITKASN